MIRLRIVHKVPDIGVNISYIKNLPAKPMYNTTLIDFSRETPENNTFIGQDRAAMSTIQSSLGDESTAIYGFPHTLVSQRALAFSFVHLDDNNLKYARPLFYKHKIGKAEYQHAASWNIRLKEEIDFSKNSPKDFIKIVDETGVEVEDFYWTVRLSEECYQSGIFSDGSSDSLAHVDKRYVLYTDRMPRSNKTYFIYFNAFNELTNSDIPNYREVLTLYPDTININDMNYYTPEVTPNEP